MSIYVDTPRWPRHGTLWGHVISDESLAELHKYADAIGLPPRAFDLDHYDFPVTALEKIAHTGAQQVTSTELTRRLIGSGLRIPAKHRQQARDDHTYRAAKELELSSAPTELILGIRGHVAPLPEHSTGFRITRDHPSEPARIEAHHLSAREAAEQWLSGVDQRLRERNRPVFIGQVLEHLPEH